MSIPFKQFPTRLSVALLGGVITLLALVFAAPALAVPQLDLTLKRAPEAVHRNDERLDYTLTVKNTASAVPQIGDELTCDGRLSEWEPSGEPKHSEIDFSYRWVRNGTPIPGAEGPWPAGPAVPGYTLTPADAGKSIQCVVTGANEVEPGVPAVNSFASQPPVVVAPEPVPAAPRPETVETRPAMGESSPGKFLCTPPGAAGEKWIGNQITWSFRWLRNGLDLGTEHVESTPTSSTYNVQPGDFTIPATLQCEAIAKDAGGNAAIVISLPESPKPPNQQPIVAISVGRGPIVNFSNTTSGQVALEMELPRGLETRVYGVVDPKNTANTPKPPVGWNCTTQQPSGSVPGSVTCTRSDALPPGASYPGVKVQATIGADAPEPTVSATAEVSGGNSGPDSAVDSFDWLPANPFEVKTFTTKAADPDGNDFTQAGGHPTAATAVVDLNTHTRTDGQIGAIEHLRNALTDLPAGLVGNPEAVPATCDSPEKILADRIKKPTCPRGSIIGGVKLRLEGEELEAFNLPLYLLTPERGVPAQLEFALQQNSAIYSLVPRVRAGEGYALSIDAPQAPKSPVLTGATVTICGYGANVRENPEDQSNSGLIKFDSCKSAEDPEANPKPFLTNPTKCAGGAPFTRLSIDSWENPAPFASDGTPILSDPRWRSKIAVSPEVSGCEAVPFEPSIELRPTSEQADSPTGLDVSISVPTAGLETPGGIAQSALKRAVVTLPKGMAVNPSAADGLQACSAAQIGLGTNDPVSCPEASKVGSAVVQTPLLKEQLQGSVYLAKQKDNPFGSLLALYLVVESKERGILVKIPGRVAPRPDGQLVSSFDDNPQLPFSSLQLSFKSGSRAPLMTPPTCGSYDIETELSPWSAADPANPTPAELRTATSSFQITSGPGGKPCPNNALEPKLSACLANSVAGATSPFSMRLQREDGTQRFASLELSTPPGLVGYLKGIPYCSDATLAAIPGAEGTGAAELANPSCPAASKLGSVTVGAGAGPNPYYAATGTAYLAGPYKGGPLSIAIVAPAVAGPFDLGNVVVRSRIQINSETAQLTVVSDPIPTVLHGIPLDVRDIRVNIDRPDFILAPTNCEAMSVSAKVGGEQGANANASSPFQVGNCAALGFKPTLTTRLLGGTKRGMNPRFRSILTAKPGQANIKRAVVSLPHSVFLDQSHIRTICTRVQFAADACPQGSIYGKATATSPLVDYALAGTVYLRSSSNPLPDVVIAFKGPPNQPIEIDLVGRIDSFKGGIRTTFTAAPDAPVSKFTLDMKGGKKGLFINSRDLCRSTSRVDVKLDAQNGRTHDFRPVLQNDCGKKKGKGKGAKKRG